MPVSLAAVCVKWYAIIMMSLKLWAPSVHMHTWLIDIQGSFHCVWSQCWGFPSDRPDIVYDHENPESYGGLETAQYLLFTAAKLVVKLCQGFECKCPAKCSYTDSFMKQILLYSAGILQRNKKCILNCCFHKGYIYWKYSHSWFCIHNLCSHIWKLFTTCDLFIYFCYCCMSFPILH